MIYAFSEPLQRAVYQRLTGDADLSALVGDAVYDAVPQVPPAETPALHVTLGEERVRDWSTKTSEGAAHDFVVRVHARTEGFARAKAAADAVCAALLLPPLEPAEGRLVNLRLILVQASRGTAEAPREIAMRFRAILEETD